MILYVKKNSINATRKLLEHINKFIYVAGYKVNTQKSVVLLYTMKHQKEKLRKHCIYYCIKKNKIPRNKPT